MFVEFRGWCASSIGSNALDTVFWFGFVAGPEPGGRRLKKWPDWLVGACKAAAREHPLGAPLRASLYGVGSGNEPPKMSELPKFGAHACSGAGAGGLSPFCSA